MIDIGANLASPQFKADLPQVLARSKLAGVTAILATGTSLEASQQVLQLAKQCGLRATAGVHPHAASSWTKEAEKLIRSMLVQPEVVAVGECGLDYNRMFSPKPAQKWAFREQLALSVEVGKPLFLHCRDAFDDFVSMLKAHPGPRGVVHCFTDSWAQAQAYLELGFDIGITGWVCDLRRGTALREAVRHIPLERLHLETDAPYLTPATAPGGGRRARNEPANLIWVAREIAALKGNVSVDQVIDACTANSRRIFRLGQ